MKKWNWGERKDSEAGVLVMMEMRHGDCCSGKQLRWTGYLQGVGQRPSDNLSDQLLSKGLEEREGQL